MKSTFVLTAAAAAAGLVLLALPEIAGGQETRSAPPTARAMMQHNANQSAQSTTDMSYGGVTDTQSATGGVNATPAPADTAPAQDKNGMPSTQAPSRW
ncbi:hypothetical protein AWB81_02747 [Caballeronia arationis]|jgi:hypothetical protein|uniref:Lipoprotein n=1 Tax=Caballeronia arationis TaxID=1777142 RepID=A0A7Z7IDF4_9BURK|nr:hypothetical protein [Caballeronia arationis]SAK66829.1 hypothetical protein AWB81_02747 [Caballeronia arationis]SOE88610.1 hypothetical protein SAMN05446927_7228 [Caballeronia arationis]